MKNFNIEVTVNVSSGNKNFTAYTMDLTKKYIEINADYRSQIVEFKIKILKSSL